MSPPIGITNRSFSPQVPKDAPPSRKNFGRKKAAQFDTRSVPQPTTDERWGHRVEVTRSANPGVLSLEETRGERKVTRNT
jgi:hypothetical protein